MFIGSWVINVIISLLAFVLVFIGSVSTNTVLTSFIRAGIAFLFFYMITYIFRWLWNLALSDTISKKEELVENSPMSNQTISTDKSYSADEVEKASQYVKDLIND